MEKTITISVFTENSIGMLNRINIIFTRRNLKTESITVSESEINGVTRYTIILKTTDEKAHKVKGQIEKIVEVLKVFIHDELETIYQEMALYKVKKEVTSIPEIEEIIRVYQARIIKMDTEFIVIEKTGQKLETQMLLENLKPFGLLEFTSSGRLVITKPMKELRTYLNELEQSN